MTKEEIDKTIKTTSDYPRSFDRTHDTSLISLCIRYLLTFTRGPVPPTFRGPHIARTRSALLT